MWRHLFCIVTVIISSFAIKVPVDNNDKNTTELSTDNANTTQENPVYISSDEEGHLDGYLIPPDPHKPAEVLSDIATPATYLLPPSAEKATDYYYTPTEPGEQSDWYPIPAQSQSAPSKLLAQRPESGMIPIFLSQGNDRYESFPVKQRLRGAKALIREQVIVPVPSDRLEPPLVNAPNEYTVSTPSEILELPAEQVNQEFADYSPVKDKMKPIYAKGENILRIKPENPKLVSYLAPPKPTILKFRNPTKLYPKKYPGSFKPVPIPIVQFAEDTLLEVPRAKPAQPFRPVPITNEEGIYDYGNPEEKKRFLYEQAELKRQLKNEEVNNDNEQQPSAADTYGETSPVEPETSETHHRYPGRNVYPAPLRQAPPPAPQNDPNAPPASDDRTEFRMHGMKGPHSYQFGYDTGKGKNRQFRYEERDNDGIVRGHYGYMDKRGKLRVVNYRAHPEHGFQADAPVEKE
ncbi:uncharacterized protein LOC113511623 [Galleria mellonella]|uniref:Uncharacterized protein LOC113511623 n=1 Tax=Galleria mellonella TaxID=7137 RepID=A0A6J1WD30_GALME|nr:uncharacterized protein LOC113511623 [Galleria mellonella]